MSVALPVKDFPAILAADAARLWHHLTLLDHLHPLAEATPETLAELAAITVRELPAEVLLAAHRLRSGRGPNPDLTLIRGLIPPTVSIEPTPNTATAHPSDGRPAAPRCQVLLLAVLSLLGEPFTFADLHSGRLVQDILPESGKEDGQTSGATVFLDWHVEDAFSADRCDYVGLLCLRADPAAETLVAPLRRMGLPASSTKVLRQPRFAVRADVGHGELDYRPQATSVISGSEIDPEFNYDSVYMSALDGDQLAAEALAAVHTGIKTAALSHRLAPGDLLIFDNRRVAHARTSFPARYDGTDRWLLRVMACSALARHRERGAVRILT